MVTQAAMTQAAMARAVSRQGKVGALLNHRAKCRLRRGGAFAVLLFLTGCGGLYFGDNPGPDVRKETGPLTVPPRSVRDGTAQ